MFALAAYLVGLFEDLFRGGVTRAGILTEAYQYTHHDSRSSSFRMSSVNSSCSFAVRFDVLASAAATVRQTACRPAYTHGAG